MKWIYVLGLALLSLNAVAQCEVDAGEDMVICSGESATLGGNPTIVQSNGNPNINWSNGVGSDENPVVSPTITTTYTVTLTGNGCNETDDITVTVLPAPNANFTFGPNNACAGVPVTFTNTTTACPSCDYEWDFGNPSSGSSNTSTANNPTHVFDAVGNGNVVFNVTLTVTAANGCTDSQTIQVSAQQAPNAVLTEDANFIQCLGVNTFETFMTDASTPANNASYTIEWGDGTPDWTSATPPNFLPHTYNGVDIFDLVYTVEGTNGCETSETYVVTNISNPAVGAANPGNTLQCGPVEFCFPLSNYQNNHPSTTYTVNFGDGSPSQTINHPPPTEICHTYSTSSCGQSPAFYTFSIEAENNCPNTSLATISPIQIGTPPIANFYPDQNPACVNIPVTFINNSIPGYNLNCSGNIAYTWDFGDGTPPVGPIINGGNQVHTYTATGTYTVTLTAGNAGSVASSCGETSLQFDICVESAPTPNFTMTPTIGCLPLVSAVDNTSNNGISCNLIRSWDVDYTPDTCTPNSGSYSYQSGTNVASEEPVFQFTSAGVYYVTLEMENACGLFTDIQTIQVNTEPEVDVLPMAAICAGQSVTPSAVIDNCNAAINLYDWDLTGGSPSSASTASPGAVTYANAGNYTISLTAFNDCGSTTASELLNVQAPPVITMTPTNPVICAGELITLTANGAVSYSWTGGSGYVSTNANTAVVAPSVTTTYTVTGTSSANCPGTQSLEVEVNPLPMVAALDIYTICAGDCIQLGLNVSGGSAPYVSYSWSPSTGLDDPSSPTPTACPTSSLVYTATVVDANGCEGTITVPVTVNPLPTVNAGPDITVCNQPVGEQLTGFSPAGGTWSGPGVTAGGLFTPTATGTFVLTYTYINANGCENADQITVTVIDPQQADAGPNVQVCLNAPAFQLVPVTPGGTWSGTGVAAGGLYTPSTTGTFTLTYSLGGGSCLSTDQITVEVWSLPQPNAGIDAAICSGDSIQLNASSIGGALPYVSTEWNNALSLSDAFILNPWATPTITTNYTLTVTDQNGCSAQDVVQIQVLSAPVVNAGPDLTLCDQPIPEVLTGYSPVTGASGTGEWTGAGVTTTGTFTPGGAGTFTLYYTFTNLAGCSTVDSIEVTVAAPVNANAGPDVTVCLNTPTFNLPAGGSWTGTNVSPAGVYNPISVVLSHSLSPRAWARVKQATIRRLLFLNFLLSMRGPMCSSVLKIVFNSMPLRAPLTLVV